MNKGRRKTLENYTEDLSKMDWNIQWTIMLGITNSIAVSCKKKK